jgi:hypothetical protein
MSLYETGVRSIIDNYLLEKSKEVRDYGEFWSASSAGYCMRKLIFERLGVPKNNEDARRQRVFEAGHIFHNFIQGLTVKAGVSIAQEVELEDLSLMIRGHFDDLVLIDPNIAWDKLDPFDGKEAPPTEKHLILYDYKTVNSRSFMWAKKNGNKMSHFHRMQLGTYMYMLRKSNVVGKRYAGDNLKFEYDYNTLSEARILKIEKDTLMMGEQQLMWTPDLEKDVVDFWRTLNGYWKKQTMPKCTCADYESGFMAKEQYNGYYYDGEPCSMKLYAKWKERKDEAVQTPTA